MAAKKKEIKPENGQSSTRNATNKQKGNLVEEITAMLHDSPNVKVERNVFLPTIGGDSKGRREIDVLLTSNIAGYSVRLAIECKNEAKVTDVEYIDAFVGKLDDVGIPHQHGVFVSVSGYTSGAIRRAKAKGIRTLVLTGLTENRLSAIVSEAWQYTVFLLPLVKDVSVFNQVSESSPEIFAFFNKKGTLCGFLPDLIWFKWQSGEIKPALGEQEIELQMPSGWQQIINGKVEPPLKLTANVEIVGIVLTLGGKVRQHSLIDSLTSKTERFRLNAEFDTKQLIGRQINFKHFFTERKLQAYMRKHKGPTLTNRIMLPRLQYQNRFYYPWSERVAGILMKLERDYETGKLTAPPMTTFYDVEGKELKNVWEPIWQGHFHLWQKERV